MRGRADLVVLTLAAVYLAGAADVQAGERLDVNGAFVGEAMPQGWGPNKPGYWDDEGNVVLTPVPDLEMTAVRLTSATRAMHLYFGKQFAAQEGDRVIVKCLMRGEGAGSLGVYFYPAGGWLKREFSVSEDWSEFSAEFTLGASVKHISVVMGIPPCASVEFLDMTAEVIREAQP